jgi:PTS system N-acetylgalactosamine-specific IIA component
MSNSRPPALLVTHGDLAEGFVSAVRQITGRSDDFVTISNAGMGADELERVIRETIERTGARVVFTDLPAGSCAICSRRVTRAVEGLVVVTGTNLATLLDFVFDEDPSPESAARRAVERGRTSLTVVGASRGA